MTPETVFMNAVIQDPPAWTWQANGYRLSSRPKLGMVSSNSCPAFEPTPIGLQLEQTGTSQITTAVPLRFGCSSFETTRNLPDISVLVKV